VLPAKWHSDCAASTRPFTRLTWIPATFIVVVNADKIRVTGTKADDKIYYRHSGFPGGIYATKFKDMQAKHPGRALEKAVKGMLPKGPLGYAMVKKLKVYAGPSHPHAAQQPKALEI
jgi:large subunit ribosomal protein L13